MKLIVLLMSVLIVSGCWQDEGKGLPEEVWGPISFNPLLVGTFSGECVDNIPIEYLNTWGSTREYLVITPDDKGIAYYMTFLGDGCEPYKALIQFKFFFEKNVYIETTPGTISAYWTLDSIELSLAAVSPSMEVFKREKPCGIESWQVTAAQDVTGKTCFGNVLPEKGTVMPDSFRVTRTQLYKGRSFNLSQKIAGQEGYAYERVTPLYEGPVVEQELEAPNPDTLLDPGIAQTPEEEVEML